MCLMLYIGTEAALPESETPDLLIGPVEAARQAVRQWFARPEVRFVGAHTGCSCGFPNVKSETPIEYFDGMHLDYGNREAGLRSIRALLDVLRDADGSDCIIELYPVWDGDEAQPPKGVIEWRLTTLDPDRFFFNEGFMHRVRK